MAILTAKNAGSGHENRGLLRQSDVSAVNRFTTFIVARSVDDCRFRLIVIDLLGRRIIVFDRWRRRRRWLDQRLQEEQEEQKEQEGTSRRSRRGRAEGAGGDEQKEQEGTSRRSRRSRRSRKGRAERAQRDKQNK